METPITVLRKLRTHVLRITEDLSADTMNAVPPGFSNNIIWNLAHLVAAQEGVCYKRNGLPMNIPEAFFEAYKPGSHPQGLANEAQIAEIRSLAASSLDQLEKDLAADRFSNYVPWTNRYDVAMSNIQDALQFLQVHEGIHAGYIMALKKVNGE